VPLGHATHDGVAETERRRLRRDDGQDGVQLPLLRIEVGGVRRVVQARISFRRAASRALSAARARCR